MRQGFSSMIPAKIPFPFLRARRMGLGLCLTCICAMAVAQPPPAVENRKQSPVIGVLDLNGDREIDSKEIDQAPVSLSKLDRNHDGMLTRDEFRPGQPPMPEPGIPTENAAPAPKSAHPNVLVMIADDLGWNGVGFHSAKAPTPNLNRLATEGMEMQRFYTYPVCSPTRAAFLTGKMPRRFGIVDALGPRQAGLPVGIATLPGTFLAAGYRTSLIGKWHLGATPDPMRCGFEHFYGHMGPQIDYFTHTDQRGQTDWQRDGKTLDESGYSTDLLADEAVRQIRQRDRDRPFFIEVAFNAPHTPHSAPAELLEKHRNGGGVLAAVIDSMDQGIGRILTALNEEKISNNTLVVFFSDNGGGRRFTSNAPLRDGKDTIYEGGIRTPCVIRWPGVLPAGVKNPQAFCVQDLFPTLATAAGLAIPVMLDGSDQWRAIRSNQPQPRPPFMIATRDTAVIDGDMKWVELETGERELYDLKSDLPERRNLILSNPEAAAKLSSIAAGLKKDLPAAPPEKSQPAKRR